MGGHQLRTLLIFQPASAEDTNDWVTMIYDELGQLVGEPGIDPSLDDALQRVIRVLREDLEM